MATDALRHQSERIEPMVRLPTRAEGDIVKAVCAATSGWVMQCSDFRDNLYALLSIDTGCNISPDYTVPFLAAYTRFAELLIARQQTILLFTNFPMHGLDEAFRGDLPSWVPDLRGSFDDTFVDANPHDNFKALSLGDGMLSCMLFSLGSPWEVHEEVCKRHTGGLSGIGRWRAKVLSSTGGDVQCLLDVGHLGRNSLGDIRNAIHEGDELIALEMMPSRAIAGDLYILILRPTGPDRWRFGIVSRGHLTPCSVTEGQTPENLLAVLLSAAVETAFTIV